MNLYSPWNLSVRRAHGVWLETDQGVFFDSFSGIGVLPLGHSWQPAVDAVCEKMKRYSHLCNYFIDADAAELARLLPERDGLPGLVCFTNSGTESTEAALKAVLKHRKPGQVILSFCRNFHGRTCGALSLTWGPAIREPFEPLVEAVVFVEPAAEALRDALQRHDVVVLWVEALQGSGGVVPMTDDFMAEVTRAQAQGILVVADEIQTGLGRTGYFYGYQKWNLKPDIVTLAKGLGGGLPLGATIFYGWEPFKAGDHGSTFAPNPAAAAAGLAVARAITPELQAEVVRKGQKLRDGLIKLPWVKQVRGEGLMLAALTDAPVAVKEEAFKRKVLLNSTSGVIRFLPALNITDDELDQLLTHLDFKLS